MKPPRLSKRVSPDLNEDFELKLKKFSSPKVRNFHNNVPFCPLRNSQNRKLAQKVRPREGHKEYSQDRDKPAQLDQN